ncbi:MAG: TetR/AcrR family transcriptional regulator [Fibrobacteres bacterium]|nr:TetR/AcrR family transcriptional regulator [Fibrobacterota bacterium]
MSQTIDSKEFRENLVRDAKRNLILDAARQVFSEKGYHDTKLEEIASRAGFSKASLYNYYEDKESLFLHLAIREHEKILIKIKEQMLPTGTFSQNLEILLRLVLTTMGEHFTFLLTVSNFQAMSGLCTCESGGNSQRIQLAQLLKATAMETAKYMEGMITTAQERGEIRKDIDPEKLNSYVGSLMRGVVFNWRMTGKKDDVEKEVIDMVQFILKGFSLCDSSR